MALISVASNKGYVDFLAFANKELVSPSSGGHVDFIDDLQTNKTAKDFHIGIIEVYSDPDTYLGCFVLQFTERKRILYIQDKTCLYYSSTLEDLDLIYSVNQSKTNLTAFFTDTLELLGNDSDALEAYLQLETSLQYGNGLLFAHLRDASNGLLASGLVQSKIIQGQALSFYVVKIDKDNTDTITMYGARNNKTSFTVEVAPGINESFNYSKLGTPLIVQRTESSVIAVKRLIAKGVVTATL